MDRKARRSIRRKSRRRRSRRNAPDELQSTPSTPTLDTVQSDRDNVQQLQGMIGNQAVSRMIQRTPIDGTIQRSVKDLIGFWENIGGGGKSDSAPASSQEESPAESSGGGGGLYSYMTDFLGGGISYSAFGDLLDSDDSGGGMDPETIAYLLSEMQSEEDDDTESADSDSPNPYSTFDNFMGGYGGDSEGGFDAETIAYLMSEMQSGEQEEDESDSASGGGGSSFYQTLMTYANANQYTSVEDFLADSDSDPFGWFDDEDSDDYDDEDDFGLESSQPVDNKEDTKYTEFKPMNDGNRGEEDDSTAFTQMLLDNVSDLFTPAANKPRATARAAQLEADGYMDPSSKKFNWIYLCRTNMGWSEEVTRQYLGDEIDGSGMGPYYIKLQQETQVEYLDEDDRRNYELHLGSTIKQGNPAETFDTGDMYSKFKGAGFGIYVMSMNGEMYSNAHQVGLFHHSSFLSGANVAGAGELKVDNGTLKYITNKSGHYWPGKEQLVQTLMELKEHGVSLSGVKVFMLPEQEEYKGDAASFLEEYGHLVSSEASNYEEDVDDDDDDEFDFDIDPDESDYIYIVDDDGYTERIKREDAPEEDDAGGYTSFVMTEGGYLAPVYSPDDDTIFYVNDEGRLETVDSIDKEKPLSRYLFMQPDGLLVPLASSDNSLAPDEDALYKTMAEIVGKTSGYYFITSEGYVEPES